MHTVHRRALLAWLAASFSSAASAQAAFPSRPLRIVVPNAAGGAADITARTVGQKIAGPLGQSVVIENKPSAGGVVAGDLVARAEPDGHTLLLVSSGTAVSAALFQSLPFDTLKDFAPVSLLATFDLAVMGAQRAPQLPDVPTVRESGGPVAGFNVTSWNGLAVPAKTPPAVVERLSREVQAALAQPDVKKRLLELNLNAQGSTPAQLGEHLAADVRRWSDVIAKAKIARQ